MSRTVQYTRKEVTTSRDNNQAVYNNVMDAIAASGLGDLITVKMYGTENIQEYYSSDNGRFIERFPTYRHSNDICRIEVRELDGTLVSRSIQHEDSLDNDI